MNNKPLIASEHMPVEIYQQLSDADKNEIQEIVSSQSKINNYFKFSLPFAQLQTTNKGLWFLSLLGPEKYSLFTENRNLTDQDLLALWEWDKSHISPSNFYAGSDEERLWSQQFNTVMAMLHNLNISAEIASIMLSYNLDTYATVGAKDKTEIAEIFGYQLIDKWNWKDISPEILQVLIEIFKEYERKDYLTKFKRTLTATLKRTNKI